MKKNTRTRKTKRRAAKTQLMPGLNPVSYALPNTRIERYRLTVGDLIGSSGGGEILLQIAINPTTSSEWSNLSALYGEFRIMGGQISICTVAADSSPNSMCIIAFDPGAAYTPSGVGDLLAYGNRDFFQIVSLDRRPYVYKFAYPSQGLATSIPWVETASAYTPTSCLLLAATSLAASEEYLTYYLDIYVQFRVRY
jgi:hypothetical protein